MSPTPLFTFLFLLLSLSTLNAREVRSLAKSLEKLGRVCDTTEDLNKQIEEADRRLAVYFLIHGRFPERSEFKSIGVNYKQWASISEYGPGGIVSHRGFHENRLAGYRAVRELVVNRDFSPDLPEELRQQRDTEIDRKIFPLLSLEERREIADNRMLKFIVENHRLPVVSAQSNDFKQLGFEFKQWVGSGEYGQDDKKAHLKFHDSEASAWKVILASLLKVEASDAFSEKTKIRLVNEIRMRIAVNEFSQDQQRDLFDRLLIEASILEGGLLIASEFTSYGLFYDRWAGIKEYRPSTSRHASAYYPSSEDGWASIARQIHNMPETEALDNPLKRRLIREAKEKRDLRTERNWAEIKEDQTDDVVLEIVRQRRIISYDEIQDLEIDASRLMGTGSFKKNGLYKNPEAFWKEVKKRIESLDRSAFLRDSDRTLLIQRLESKIKDAKERLRLSKLSREKRTADRNQKVARFILENRRAPIDVELNSIGFNNSKWLGTGAYRPSGQYAEYADHLSPQDAYQSVLALIQSDDALTKDDRDQASRIIREKIQEYDNR